MSFHMTGAALMKRPYRVILARAATRTAIAGILLVMSSAAHAQDAVAARPRGLTFAKDIAPIFQQKCEGCHRAGSMAPMSLVTYEDARPWVRSIKARIASREMPPWYLDKTVGIQKFKNDRSLSDAEIRTVIDWIDSGAPFGEKSDLPAPVKWPSDATWLLSESMGTPDLVVNSATFTMPANAPDVWWRPVVDIGLKEDRWLRAIEVRPSLKGRKVVHHSGTFLYQPEDAAVLEAEKKLRAGQGTVDALLDAMRHPSGKVVEPEPDQAPQFAEWAIGKPGDVFAENTGKLMRAGAKLGFEIHYHAVGEEVTDTTEVGLWFYPKGVVPTYPVTFAAMAAVRNIEIPPNTVKAEHGYYTLPAPAIINNFQPHMHLRGKAFLMEAIYPDGRTEVLNYVPKWAFNWHVSYIYDDNAAPILPKGTVIHNVIWYDNTTANKQNPDPRQWVSGGARSVDEMGHANTNLVFITEAEYQRLTQERKDKAAAGQRSY